MRKKKSENCGKDAGEQTFDKEENMEKEGKVATKNLSEKDKKKFGFAEKSR